MNTAAATLSARTANFAWSHDNGASGAKDGSVVGK